MDRAAGLSVRVKLTLSYAGFLMVTGVLLLGVVWVFLLRYVPDGPIQTTGPFVPNRSDLLRAFGPRAAWALAFLLVFGLVGGWILAGRMLRPLDRITEAARMAAAGSLSHRIALEGPDDEFRELADTFDAMLARLEAHVGQQQRFAANASHELRTPLAITQTLLDVARNDPHRDTDELIGRLHAVNARAIDLTEALLLLSRAERRSFAREQVDLSLIAEEAAETLLPVAETHSVSVATSGDVAPAQGSRALLLQMTTNLLHNAIVHNVQNADVHNVHNAIVHNVQNADVHNVQNADVHNAVAQAVAHDASPGSDGWVQLRTAVGGGWTWLIVENSGPVLDPDLVATLTEPFQRGTARIRAGEGALRSRQDHVGVGLGLAIVKSIVEAHDGVLSIAARPGGGLHVTVRLPAG